MPILSVNEHNFQQEVLQSELPTLVDLYADWCEPCKVLEPILAEIAQELSGKLKIVRVDVEKSPVLAQSFRVQSIPMLVLFDKGNPVDQVVGLVDKNALLALVKPVLPTNSSEISPKELSTLIAQGQAVAIDIREKSDYHRYHIPSAIHLEADAVAEQVNTMTASDGPTRVLYSRSTDQAKELSERLYSQGTRVSYLAGGFLGWEAEGLEIERGS
ncbi:MAG: thioredoxin [Myxococcales bacterium]|nr:thioredoxin [Myxococcales bacterium]MCB9708246.1 thioredoxin [Myxococcales bacterium]